MPPQPPQRQLTIPQALQVALQNHQAGRLGQAEHMYREILKHAPQHPDALHLLGVLLSQNDKHDDAAQLIERAIEVNPTFADYHNNLGEALRRSGKTERAVESYQRALHLRPDYLDAQNNLSIALAKLGRAREGFEILTQALQRDPNNFELLSNLGVVLLRMDRVPEAADAFRQALRVNPKYAEAHNGFGDALCLLGQTDQAIVAYQTAIQLKGGLDSASMNNLAEALMRKGRLDEAIDAFKRIRDIKPDAPDAHNNLGLLLERRGRTDEAVQAYEQAIKVGQSPEAHNNLANYLNRESLIDRSIDEFHKALAIDPNFYEAWNNLANAYVETGRLDEALEAHAKGLAINPRFPGARSNRLMATLYHPAYNARRVYDEHRVWDEMHGQPLTEKSKPHENDRSPNRRLRVGYVSPDFRSHAVAFFSLSPLQLLDREQIELFCYSASFSKDGITERFQKAADRWHNIVGMSDEEADELIRNDKIDILIDLAGHTAANRLPLMAMRPAPVQINAWGYPSTTGLRSIDWRISDERCDPAGIAEPFNSERLLRLPDTFWCYTPPDTCPEVSDEPATKNGHITYGSFNNLAKVTAPMLALWAQILSRDPKSKLIIKAAGCNSDVARRNILETFSRHGIASDRVRLLGRSGFQEYMQLFAEVDILLDTHPFGGGTTTCHALWMGVPVVTLVGDRHASRMGLSIATAVGLRDWAVNSSEEYVERAIAKASDVSSLSELRRTMRDRLRASALMDAKRFTKHLDDAYRRCWVDWCGSQK
jgi:predicted O-linked N-acetylglucosamine transferase (SPINDLY family)